MGRHNLREVAAADTALCTVDGVSCYQYLRLMAKCQFTAEITGNDQHDVCTTLLDFFQGSLVRRLLTTEDEVVALLYAVHHLLTLGRMVVVDHADADVLHLLVHHPRHDAHDHDGEHEDELGQKQVATYLQELLL